MLQGYKVRQIPKSQTHIWLLKKHYAKRVPSIIYAFGLFDDASILQGVCTFGYPPIYNYNNGKCVFHQYRVLTLELNRLVTNEGLPPNSLSFFVAKALKLLPPPCCVVSYADPNQGHLGFIYQATNWIYTGVSTPKKQYTFESGEVFSVRRGIHRKGKVKSITVLLSTHRYLKFVGSKREVKQMRDDLKMPVLTYPKGETRRYDASYNPPVQRVLI